MTRKLLVGIALSALIVFSIWLYRTSHKESQEEQDLVPEDTSEYTDEKPKEETLSEDLKEKLLLFRSILSGNNEKIGDYSVLGDKADLAKAEALVKRLLALDIEKQRPAVDSILSQIKEIGYPALKPILDLLKIQETEKRMMLLLMALDQIEDARITSQLTKLFLTSSSEKVRAKACEMFQNRATKDEMDSFLDESRAVLLKSEGKDSPIEKFNRIDALGLIGGAQAFDLLKNTLRSSSDYKMKERSIKAIGKIKSMESQEFLFDIFTDEATLRLAVISALSEFPSSYATRRAIAIIEGADDRALKIAAINILGGQDTPEANSYLLRIIETSDDPSMINEAAKAAGKIKSTDTAQYLAQIMTTTEDRSRLRFISQALAKMGEGSIKYLEEVADGGSSAARSEAVRALSQIRGPKAYDALRRILDDAISSGDTITQREALQGLKTSRSDDAAPTVERLALESRDPSIRRTAMETAVNLRKKDQLAFITQIYEQDDSDLVKRAALRMMRRYGDEQTIKLLRRELLYRSNAALNNDIERTIEEIEKRRK